MTKIRIIGNITLITLLVIIFFVTSTPIGRVATKTTLFVTQIIPNLPVRPLEWISKAPSRQQISFKTSNGEMASADLYLPSGNDRNPAVIFFMGVVPPNRNDERIVSMSEGLARTGTAVLIPWLETQNAEIIIKEDIESLISAYEFLELHNRVIPEKIGMAGICTGASMAIIAAQDSRINHKVHFVNAFAGYYDARDLIKAVSTKTKSYRGTSEPWIPDRLTTSLVNKHLIYGSSEKDKLILKEILTNGYWTKEDRFSLSPQGQSTLDLISGTTISNAEKAIENLPVGTRAYLEEISPSTKVADIQTKVLLMHDTSDLLIPPEESKRFAEDLSSLNKYVYHTEFTFFKNVLKVHKSENERTSTINLINQTLKLYLHMYNVMRLLS